MTPSNLKKVERIVPFQSLQAGQYWKATKGIPEQGIEQGTVLLIQSIRWVEDVEHTIILRPHPSKIGHSENLEIPQEDGTTYSSYFKYKEHRFLVEEFLSLFEFEPDYERVRGAEVQAVQDRVVALQKELLDTQANPLLLQPVIEEELKKEGDLRPAGPEDRKLLLGTLAEAMQAGVTTQTVKTGKYEEVREVWAIDFT